MCILITNKIKKDQKYKNFSEKNKKKLGNYFLKLFNKILND